MKPLAATARLQFHKDFTLDDAERLVPYFARLGISHLYASPIMKARAGSTHGYDIVDHSQINPELGGEDALRRLVATLRQHEMGLILDIVPNHMGVGGDDNVWWMDVLEWGRNSPFAEVFDIDWDPPDSALRGRMLAPFLGSSYGECLANGELSLKFDAADGTLYVAYYSHRFPITPRDYPAVLLTEGGVLEEPARLFNDLGTGRTEMRRHAEAARMQLRDPAFASAIAEALRAYDPATEGGRDRLHRLLERQHYRLAWWRAAADEINWRRFFDVNGLAGVRAEIADVFELIHAKILSLFEEGLIDGVRIDHVDGLADPRGYCRKLRRKLEAARDRRPAGLSPENPVLWVEKILAPHERLATDWLTDGTTGYDFMSDAAAVLHDPAGEARLTDFWATSTGRPASFETEVLAARRQILRESLSSELFAVATLVHRLARRDLKTRDYTLTAVRRAVNELLVHFRVYRIYAGPGGISEVDRRVMDWALAGARRTVRPVDRPLLEHVVGWLCGDGLRDAPAGLRRNEWLRAMVRFQQLSSPTAAKSVEDTAFYRYGRLLSRNEVGSEPSQFSLSVAAWHEQMKDRRKRFPRALLATATHDHKRGEDTRIRIAVISEIPDEWAAAVQRWSRLNVALKRDLDPEPGVDAPDNADEEMLYQTLVGAWPLDLSPDDAEGLAAFRDRIWAWWEKALREAKRRTGWAAPDEGYETACRAFLDGVLSPDRPARVVADIAAFAARIAPAGAANGLSQMLLRLTSPGIPDLYQGTEYWDLSLVDPDNRRPVDFAARNAVLEAGEPLSALTGTWQDGRVKLQVLHQTLQVRARVPGLFAAGSYVPLRVEGPHADNLLAFARVHEGQAVIVVAARLVSALLMGSDGIVPTREAWGGTTILLPRNLSGRHTLSAFDGSEGSTADGRLDAGTVLSSLPVALLEVR